MKTFSQYLMEEFPGMTSAVEASYHRKNKNGRKKGGIMPKPSVGKMKGIVTKTGERADSFFY